MASATNAGNCLSDALWCFLVASSTPPPQTKEQAFESLAELSANNSADDVTAAVRDLFRFTHPNVGSRGQVVVGGNKKMDLLCGGVVVETKKPGTLDETKDRLQVGEYLDELASKPRLDLGDDGSRKWKGVLTDGSDWCFYEHTLGQTMGDPSCRLTLPGDNKRLEAELLQAIDVNCLAAPPVEDRTWFDALRDPFANLAEDVAGEPYFEVKQKLWEDALAGAQMLPPGNPGESLELFVSHTLLVATARIIADAITTYDVDITEGFAAWIKETPDGDEMIADLVLAVKGYEWQVGRDILKDFYQTAIPEEMRKSFGEYYTPDWLAQAVVEEVCDEDWCQQMLELSISDEHVTPKIADPACGSGAFIYAAIKHLESHIPNVHDPGNFFGNDQTKATLLNRLVAGIDLHPVAVELAQATKLMALGADPGETLNVWMGDSLQWFRKAQRSLRNTVEIHTSEKTNIELPESFVLSEHYESGVDTLMETAGRDTDIYDLAIAEAVVPATGARSQDDHDGQIVADAIATLRGYMQTQRNGVWGWYLKNIAQPFRLSETKVERLVGNPPWLTSKDMSPDARQQEFITQAKEHGVWAGANLAPQNDLAALFVAATVKLYLVDGGGFGFVLPAALVGNKHWGPFRTGNWNEESVKKKTLFGELKNAWDLSKVKHPPFSSAPSSVVFGNKAGQPSPLTTYEEAECTGVEHSDDWVDVKQKIGFEHTHVSGTGTEYYSLNKFKNGATLFPQSLVIADEATGMPKSLCRFRTNDSEQPWGAGREGTVEKNYALKAVFSKHIVPFGVVGYRYLIAPIKNKKFVDVKNKTGSTRMGNYWGKASTEYKEKRSSGSPDTLEGQINFHNKLIAQLDSRSRELKAVVYNRSGAYLCASVIPTNKIIDGTLNYYFTSDDEAHYLCAIFNAPVLRDFFSKECRATPGSRHFHLRPVENLPIPLFDKNNIDHSGLSELSRKVHKKVRYLNGQNKLKFGPIKNRSVVLSNKKIQQTTSEIDVLVANIFSPQYLTP